METFSQISISTYFIFWIPKLLDEFVRQIYLVSFFLVWMFESSSEFVDRVTKQDALGLKWSNLGSPSGRYRARCPVERVPSAVLVSLRAYQSRFLRIHQWRDQERCPVGRGIEWGFGCLESILNKIFEAPSVAGPSEVHSWEGIELDLGCLESVLIKVFEALSVAWPTKVPCRNCTELGLGCLESVSIKVFEAMSVVWPSEVPCWKGIEQGLVSLRPYRSRSLRPHL